MYARLGRFCFAHQRAVLLSWLVVLVVGIGVGGGVFGRLKESNGGAGTESVKGFNIVDDHTAMGPSAIAVVDGARVSEPATRAAVERLSEKLRGLRHVESVVDTYSSTDPRLRAEDGRASLIVVRVRKNSDDPMAMHEDVDRIRDAVKGQVPGASIRVGGDLGVMRDQMATSQRDLFMGELIALPILVVALFFVFHGVRPALLPLAGALVTTAGALLLLLAVTHFTDVASYAVDVVVLFGLALAVDYSLLIVNRFREERATGAQALRALERTVASAGRTITFSALTVAAALAGLFAFRDPTFTSLALGGISTSLVALAAGLTLVPALLARWADKIQPAERMVADDGFFGRLARRVQRHPWAVALGVSGLLLAAAIPFLSARFGSGDPRTLPRSIESRTVADTLAARFPGKQADPVQVVARLKANDPRVQAYAARIKRMPGVVAVEMEPGLHGNASAINAIPTGTSQGAAAMALVRRLRADRPGYATYVSGSAAFLADFKHQISSHALYAALWIAAATFALLFLMTGSALVPIKALVMNTLSLGATFGALAWVFQDGHLSGLLGFDAFGAIEVWVPVVVFVFAFGLSMDYEVFLLSRIKECYEECGNNDRAVANGLQRSGRIITSAAVLVMIVFLGFAAGRSLGVKEMGLSLAIAVLVDATLVRCLLVPATMTLLGDRNWWAPAPLRRLYDRFGLHEEPAVVFTGLRTSEPASADGAVAVTTPMIDHEYPHRHTGSG
jgi:putative drug exporter of the RND superfamily